MSFLHLSTGILDHFSFANCSRSFRLKDAFSQLLFLSFHRCSVDSDLTHFRTFQHFVCYHFWVLLKCVSGHCPAGRPMTSGGEAAFWHWVAPQNSLVIIRFHETAYTVKASSVRSSKATQNIFESPPCLSVGTVFFSLRASFLFL